MAVVQRLHAANTRQELLMAHREWRQCKRPDLARPGAADCPDILGRKVERVRRGVGHKQVVKIPI